MLKVVYFDYHGVLDQRTYAGFLATIGRTWLEGKHQLNDQTLADFIQHEREKDMSYAIGEVPPHNFWARITREYGSEVDRAGRAYLLHVEPLREMWNLVSSLHDRYDTGLCTDCSLDKKEVIRSAYALTDYFDYLIFSCDVQLTKRDPEIYSFMLQHGLYRPEECLLVDDTESNTKMAADLGYQTHLYRNLEAFRDYLEFKDQHPES